MKKILILGGFGFLGKNLNKTFKSSDYKIYNESRRTGCNVLDYNILYNKVKEINPDIIINSVANVGGVGYVSKKAADVCSDNTQFFINIYKVVKDINSKIVIINPLANCSYPGDTLDILEESNWWNGEVHESVESYGSTKKMGFIISECYRKQYGIKTINLLVPNAYGPFDYDDEERTHAMNGIIIRLLKTLKNKETNFNIWGTGNPVREWVYMEDVAKIIKIIIDNEIMYLPNPINIGQEEGFSINETVSMVQNIMKTNFTITHDITKKEGAPKKIMSSKLFNEYFPEFRFTKPNEGIKNTIAYYENII
jgi:GDP-L-fucose synthase